MAFSYILQIYVYQIEKIELWFLFRFLFAAAYPGVRTARSPFSGAYAEGPYAEGPYAEGPYAEGRSLHSNAKDFSQLLRSAADSIDTFERYIYLFFNV